MIIIILGTRAQLIKMVPIILQLEKSNLTFNLLFTGQHKETMIEILNEFNVQTTPKYLYTGEEVTSISQVPLWFFKCIYCFINTFKKKLNYEKKVVLVHGDTFSTLLGAILAKSIKAKVAHIEAGLRSYNFLHPFPEEITRIITFYLSDISFCPGKTAYDNMSKYNTERIDTKLNTLIDSTNLVLKDQYINKTKYTVCSIHRFENIFFKQRFLHIINLLNLISNKHKIIFVLHPATKNNLIKYGFYKILENNKNIEIQSRMTYSKFIKLLSGASFVITDGGSNQEELYYMGIPTLLLRKKTERDDGICQTTILSNHDEKTVINFIENYDKYRKTGIINNKFDSPSAIIVAYFESLFLPSR